MSIFFRLFAYLALAPLVILRLILAIILVCTHNIYVKIGYLLYKPGSKEMRAHAFTANSWTGKIGSYMCSIMNTEVVKKEDVCYKKYLGPNWTPRWDNFSTVVINHSSWVDIPILMSLHYTSFVSKASNEKTPFVGIMNIAGEGLFLKRGSKDDRALMF